MVFQIAIIGAGQIGSRHLQALSRIDRNISIFVFDPSQKSLETAKNRFQELPANPHVHCVSYINTLEGLKGSIDVAIVATSADIRRQVIEALLQKVEVRAFILEKVVFQSVTDFEAIISLFKERKIKAWVNCSYRRMFPFYQSLKKYFGPEERMHFNLYGAGWGLACNSIHMLDLFSYLSGQTKLRLDGAFLDKAIHESKREGFIELTGTLRGIADNGSEISLLNYHGVKAPYVINLFGKHARCIIFESERKAFLAVEKDNWKWEEQSFEVYYQSQLTHFMVQKILDSGDCYIASLEDAFSLHEPMLNVFNTHLKNTLGKTYEKCPIT